MTHAFVEELEKHVLTDMKRMLRKLCDDMPVLQANEVMVWFDGYTSNTSVSAVSTKLDPNIGIMDGPAEPVTEVPKKPTARGKKKVQQEANAEASNAEASNAEPKKKTAARGKKKVVENAESNTDVVVEASTDDVAEASNAEASNAEASNAEATTSGIELPDMCDSYYPK